MSICSIGHLYYFEQFKMNKKTSIRSYNSEDFDEIQNLWNLTKMGGKERGDTNEVILKTIEAGGKFIILELQNKIIGTAWITHDFRRSCLHHFCIHPEYQGQSYAHLLMQECMSLFKILNYQAKLEVYFDNFKAINLYKKYDFKPLEGYNVLIKREI
jgi:ribosomal protein S18 acetylase RimI-like enzyme